MTDAPISLLSRRRIGVVTTAVCVLSGMALTPDAEAAVLATGLDAVYQKVRDVRLHATENDDEIAVLDERQCFTLKQDLQTDTNTISATSYNVVSSHLIHFDPESSFVGLEGTVKFDGPIIGVISGSQNLDASDRQCGNPRVAYPAAGDEPVRGLESFQVDDHYAIAPTPGEIEVSMWVPHQSDQIRVITCCPKHNCDPSGPIPDEGP